jgi:hypothetical protein
MPSGFGLPALDHESEHRAQAAHHFLRVRHMLVESAWTYRHPSRIGKAKLYRLEAGPPKVREIAWKAQTWLTARYRALSGRGKKGRQFNGHALAPSHLRRAA